MADDKFNMSLRKFLKHVGVTSQQEIERLVRDKSLRGKGKLRVKMVLTAEGTELNHVIDGEIDLDS
jgi:16S rRNA U516 pseudouridylate synthase RsuA-like enzyme